MVQKNGMRCCCLGNHREEQVACQKEGNGQQGTEACMWTLQPPKEKVILVCVQCLQRVRNCHPIRVDLQKSANFVSWDKYVHQIGSPRFWYWLQSWCSAAFFRTRQILRQPLPVSYLGRPMCGRAGVGWCLWAPTG